MADLVAGVELLRACMSKRGLSQEAVGKLTGVSQVAVSAWLAGRARPKADARTILEAAYNIPASAWRTPEEEAAVRAVFEASEPTGTEG